jgi:hypothetical protein
MNTEHTTSSGVGVGGPRSGRLILAPRFPLSPLRTMTPDEAGSR